MHSALLRGLFFGLLLAVVFFWGPLFTFAFVIA